MINNFLYKNICNKNIEMYNEIIKNISDEFYEVMDILCLNRPNSIEIIRKNIHKLCSTIMYLDNNEEIIYICKLFLFIDKKETDITKYYPYLDLLSNMDKSKFIFYKFLF